MRSRALALLAALSVLALGALASTARAEDPKASALAFALVVTADGGTQASAGYVTAPPQASANVGSYVFPAGDDASVALSGGTTHVRTGPGAGPSASATTTISSVSLFDGEVLIEGIDISAEASASGDESTGSLGGAGIGRAVVLGEEVAVAPNSRTPLAEWGYVVFLEQAVLSEDEAGPGYRGFVTAAHVVLTADHGGLAAGTEILIGYAEAAARPPEPTTVSEPAEVPTVTGPVSEPKAKPPGAKSEPPPIVRKPPKAVQPDITGKGYVFPVYGQAAFSDDFGAARATTGWHHGNDIFAPIGSPVLAVASGELFSVGWNEIGGWRLWLRDERGNEFYYAHLSAFSPLAFDGSRVRAGAVIGFVGATGDAYGTPPHLHFEVHPAGLLGLGYDGVINPHSYLVGWQRSRDVDFGIAVADVAAQWASAPGAVLLEAQDISTASGLVPGSLAGVLGLTGEGTGTFTATRAPLVGGPPGFA